MPEEESISRKDYFAHTMYKVKSSEAIRQAKQFDTEMGNQSVNCSARMVLSYLVSNRSALKIWSSSCRETG